jgi:hypothetical protein
MFACGGKVLADFPYVVSPRVAWENRTQVEIKYRSAEGKTPTAFIRLSKRTRQQKSPRPDRDEGLLRGSTQLRIAN